MSYRKTPKELDDRFYQRLGLVIIICTWIVIAAMI